MWWFLLIFFFAAKRWQYGVFLGKGSKQMVDPE
jgi:hypothetical protein